MNTNLEKKELEELEIEVLKGKESINKNTWKYTVIITLVLIVLAIICFSLNNILSPSSISFILIIFAVIVVFAIKFLNNKNLKENKRTLVSIPFNNMSKSDVDIKLKNILSELQYKEKKYKDSIVYYAFKTKFNFINVESLPRYITYNIYDNYIDIQAWHVVNKKEQPINSDYYGTWIKQALLQDLYYIRNSIQSNNSNNNVGMTRNEQ